MALTFTTGNGSRNLASSTFPNGTVVKILVEGFYLGPTVTDEVVIAPRGNPTPTIAARTYRRSLMTVPLKLAGTSANNLIADAELIRAEFIVANTVSYGIGTPVTITTYPSDIDPITEHHILASKLAELSFVVPRWVLQVWRHPFRSGATVPLVG